MPLRTVRNLSVHSSVRITPGQERSRQPKRSRPCAQALGDIRRARDSSAARSTDILRGSYLISEQSPASSQTAPWTGAWLWYNRWAAMSSTNLTRIL